MQLGVILDVELLLTQLHVIINVEKIERQTKISVIESLEEERNSQRMFIRQIPFIKTVCYK